LTQIFEFKIRYSTKLVNTRSKLAKDGSFCCIKNMIFRRRSVVSVFFIHQSYSSMISRKKGASRRPLPVSLLLNIVSNFSTSSFQQYAHQIYIKPCCKRRCSLICTASAQFGRLHILQWARANGCEWDSGTTDFAAEGGHLEVLQWAIEIGCPVYHDRVCDLASEHGHFHVLEWLVDESGLE
jgi:hypothetical protein